MRRISKRRREGFLVLALVTCGLLTSSCGVAAELNSAFLNPTDKLLGTPDDFGLRYEEQFLTRDGDRRIRTWFVHPEGDPKGTVVLCNGNTGNISYLAPYYRMLAGGGFQVLMFDYQGYGGSSGEPEIGELLRDMPALLDYLNGRADVDAERLAIYGISLGSMVAFRAAADHDAFAVVVSDATGSPGDSVARVVRDAGYRSVATGIATWYVGTFVLPWGIEPDANAGRTNAEVLLIHGEDDRIFDMGAASRVLAVAEGRSRLWAMPGTGHAPEPLIDYDGEYQAAVLDFLELGLDAPERLLRVAWEDLDEQKVRVRVASPGAAPGHSRPLEIALVQAGEILGVHRVWLDGAEGVYELPAAGGVDAVGAHVYARARRDGGSWVRELTPLGRAGAYHERLRPLRSSLRVASARLSRLDDVAGASETPIESVEADRRAARAEVDRVIAEIQSVLDEAEADGVLEIPRFNAELAGVYALVGAILAPRVPGDPSAAVPWLRRAVDAVPERPSQHAWFGNAQFTTGFTHEESVRSVGRWLVSHYRSSGDMESADQVERALSRLGEPSQ